MKNEFCLLAVLVIKLHPELSTFHAICRVLIFQIHRFPNNPFRNTIRVWNSLDSGPIKCRF